MMQKSEKKSIFESTMLRTRVRSANVKFSEMLFGYLIGPFGALLVSGILGAQITTYWKYVLFAAEYADPSSAVYQTVSTFTTILPIVSAILIVAGNLIVGQLIERTKTRAGKARPWILFSSVLLAVSCVLMFVMPSDDTVTKMVFQAISYNLYYAIAYPMYNTANSTLIPVSTRNAKHRSLLASATNIASLGVMGAGSMVFPLLIDWVLGYQSIAWTIAFVVIAVFSFLACILQYYFTRERVSEETMGTQKEQKKVPLKTQLKSVASEKAWWGIIIFYLFFQFSGALKNASMYDFCAQVIDQSFGAGAMQSILGIVGAIPMAAAIVIIWPLSNKFNKKIVTLGGMLIGVAGGVLAGVGGNNPYLVAVGVGLKCFGSAPACYMILAMIADVLDHVEAKSGNRCDGLTMSIYSAIMIAATPVCVGIYNGILGATGFSSEALVQSDAVKNVISVSYIWVETIAYALCAIFILFFDVEKGLPEDQRIVRERQKAEALAAGIEWVEPEERLRREQEEAEREAEEARIAELRAKCEKKGLDFEQEEEKYRQKLARKAKNKPSATPAQDAQEKAPDAQNAADDAPDDGQGKR